MRSRVEPRTEVVGTRSWRLKAHGMRRPRDNLQAMAWQLIHLAATRGGARALGTNGALLLMKDRTRWAA